MSHEWKAVYRDGRMERLLRYHGLLSGNHISGTSSDSCSGETFPITGELLDGGSRIVLQSGLTDANDHVYEAKNPLWDAEFKRQCIVSPCP